MVNQSSFCPTNFLLAGLLVGWSMYRPFVSMTVISDFGSFSTWYVYFNKESRVHLLMQRLDLGSFIEEKTQFLVFSLSCIKSQKKNLCLASQADSHGQENIWGAV
jgi:hypothetical protein